MRNLAAGVVSFFILTLLGPMGVVDPTTAAEPGDTLWTQPLNGGVWAPLTAHEGTVFVASDDGSVTAHDLQSRKLLWTVETDGPVRSSVVAVGTFAVFSSDDGNVHAVDAKTGAAQWRTRIAPADFKRHLPAPTPPYDYDSMQSSPVTDGVSLFVGSADGTFRALDLQSGAVRWSFDTGGRIRATAALDDGTVYCGSWDGNVYALEAESGELRWKHSTGGVVQGAVAVGSGHVVVGSRSGRIQALEAATGTLVWEFIDPNGSWIESSPVIHEGVVYIGSSDARQMFAFSLDSGKQLWAAPTGGWSWGTPVVHKDEVYIGAVGAFPYGQKLEGGFFAFDRHTGEQLWDLETATIKQYVTGGVFAAPVVVDDVVYIATVDGSLLAVQR